MGKEKRNITLTIYDVTWELQVVDFELIMDGIDVILKIRYVDAADIIREHCATYKKSVISENYMSGSKTIIKVGYLQDCIQGRIQDNVHLDAVISKRMGRI